MISFLGDTMRHFLLVIIISIAVPAMPLFAQSDRRAVLLQDAPIMLTPTSTTPLHVGARGSSLIFLKTDGEWTQVQFQDPRFGLRTGVVQTRYIRVEGPPAPAPMDLSVPKVTEVQRQPQPPLTPQAPRAEAAMGTRAQPGRVFIDFNRMSAMEGRSATSFTSITPRFTSVATATAVYPEVDTIWGWDLSGAFGAGSFGGGARWLRETYAGAVPVNIRVPHPFNLTFATDTDSVLNGLDGSQDMIDFHAMYSVNESRWRFVAFGGPSYFRLTQTMINTVNFTQSFVASSVNITGASLAETKGNTWGFNVGADGTWFFSRFVGVGAGLRVNRGTVQIIDPLSGDEVDWQVGVTSFVFGPRFRF